MVRRDLPRDEYGGMLPRDGLAHTALVLLRRLSLPVRRAVHQWGLRETNCMDMYNDKVKARTTIAEALQTTYRGIAAQVGLLDDDLAVIVTEGRNAAQADADQQAQRAEQSADISLRAADIAEVLQRETALRALVPAVVGDLERAGASRVALVLQRMSYERFRVRELLPSKDAPPPTDEEVAEIRRFARVPREDHVTRLEGLAAWIDGMRAPGREPIAEALARRGLPAADLEALATLARTLAAQGRNVRQSVEATAREAAAVEAQRSRWNSVRRLVRLAATKDEKLAALLAAC